VALLHIRDFARLWLSEFVFAAYRVSAYEGICQKMSEYDSQTVHPRASMEQVGWARGNGDKSQSSPSTYRCAGQLQAAAKDPLKRRMRCAGDACSLACLRCVYLQERHISVVTSQLCDPSQLVFCALGMLTLATKLGSGEIQTQGILRLFQVVGSQCAHVYGTW
jgi:hypothetical protein